MGENHAKKPSPQKTINKNKKETFRFRGDICHPYVL